MENTDSELPLHDAVRDKNWELVQDLIHRGADVNLLDASVKTPLHIAVKVQAPKDIVAQLISPQNINMQNKNGLGALHMVQLEKQWDLVPLLLQHGADIDLSDRWQDSPLHYAVCSHAPEDIVTQLISPENVNRKATAYGFTPLHSTMLNKKYNYVPILVQHGGDANLADKLGYTVLHRAVFAPTDIFTLLITPQNINMQNETLNTPLHVALKVRSWRLVPVLLQRGANVNLIDDGCRTPLYRALQGGAPVDIITQLVSPQNVNIQADDKRTALHLAVVRELWELVPVLLTHGADINLVDDENNLPFCIAVSQSNTPPDVITELISPSNINKEVDGGNTPLRLLCLYNRWDLVPTFLQKGADINLHDNMVAPLQIAIYFNAPAETIYQLTSLDVINLHSEGGSRTALHNAVTKKRWDVVPMLIEHGANINLGDATKNTPLHEIIEVDPPDDVFRMLLSPENINAQNTDGQTALHKAAHYARWALMPTLIEHGADVNILDASKCTVLHLTIRNCPMLSRNIITQLASVENINQLNEYGQTALHLLASRRLYSLVPVLLEHGANTRMVLGFSPELSLKDLCIATIRSHMIVTADEALEALNLPRCLIPEMKMMGIAQQFIAWWKQIMLFEDELENDIQNLHLG